MLRWYSDPKNVEEVLSIVRRTRSSHATGSKVGSLPRANYRDPKGIPDLKALQGNLGLLKELGFLKSDIDVASYSDLSLVKAAGSRAP